MSLLGIDIGTSGCKAVVFSEVGLPLAAAYEEYDHLHPQSGWAELDTEAVWRSVCAVIRRAVAGATGDPVRALSISSLGEAVVPVRDRPAGIERLPLATSILNFDARGEAYLRELGRTLPNPELYARNGNTLGNNYSLTKLKWIREHLPELYDRTDLFLHWSGFVAWMLGADPAVDYSLANRTLLFDLDRENWSDALLEWAGLDRSKLPRAVPSGAAIGQVHSKVAAELGLPPGVEIITGAHDQCAGALGCGVISPGQAVFGMGTFLCITPVFEERRPAGPMISLGLNTEHHAAPGRFVSFIYNQGGSLVKWYRDTFATAERRRAQESGEDLYPALFAELPPGPSNITVLPHFTVTGPPAFITDSSGVIAGLRLETTRGEILKGILESTSFYLKEIVESLPSTGITIDTYRVSGGGSKSDLWIQLCATIFGRPFIRPKVTEAGTLGAALMAGVGSGLFHSVEEAAAAMVRIDRVYEPDRALQSRYEERFQKYRRLWPLLSEYLRS